MRVERRTFEAKDHPAGSEARARLNQHPLTSEYMPSYRYMLVEDDGAATPWSYRTKAEAEAEAGLKIREAVVRDWCMVDTSTS